MMVDMSVMRAKEVGALTVIDTIVFHRASSYTTFPEYKDDDILIFLQDSI
jgi:hypothetical protein